MSWKRFRGSNAVTQGYLRLRAGVSGNDSLKEKGKNMKLHNDTIQLSKFLRELQKHLDLLEHEQLPLSPAEVTLLRQLEATLPMEINLVQWQIIPCLVRLLKRSKHSKTSEETGALNFPLPKSSELKSPSGGWEKAEASVMLNKLFRLLQSLKLAREQRRCPVMVPTVEIS